MAGKGWASIQTPCRVISSLDRRTIRRGLSEYHKNTQVYPNITLELYQCDAEKTSAKTLQIGNSLLFGGMVMRR
jgi:hypothetical protein